MQGKTTETHESVSDSDAPQEPINSNGTGPSGFLESSGLAENVADDPIFIFLQKNWRFLMVLCIAFALVYFARSAYLRTFEDTMRGAADVFAVTRSEYKELIASLDEIKKIDSESEEGKEKLKATSEKRDQSLSRLRSNLVALRNEREPYKSFSALYSGLSKLAMNDIVGAEADFGSLNWENLSAESSTDRLVAELAALNIARAKLDSDKSSADGKSLLLKLARNGHFVNVSAATVLGMIAQTEEDKTSAAGLISEILQNNPEQSDVLQPELDRLSE